MAYFSANYFAPTASGGASVPAEAPSLAFSSKDDDSITVTVTAPSDQTNYSLTRIFYAIPGGARSETTTSTTTSADVTLPSLNARTHYLIVAVAESAGGAQLGASEILSVYTTASGSDGTGVDGSKILRTPGRLCINPTDLTADFPHGGTNLGGARSVRLEVDTPHLRVPNPEKGGLQETFEGNKRIRFVCILREFSDAVLSTLFRSAVTGGTSAEKGIAFPQSGDVPGKKGTDRAVKLLWVPYNTAQHPAVLIPRAIPILSQSLESLGAFQERTRLVEFEGAVDATGRLYLEQLVEDMTL